MKYSSVCGLTALAIATALAPSRSFVPRVELDHVFIVVSPGDTAEIAALRSAGFFIDKQPSRHDGQGTASVAVYFQNAYLELIWIDSSVSVRPEHAQTLQWFRKAAAWRASKASPFGLGLRRLVGDTSVLPVPVQREFAAWLPPGSAYELLRQPADSLAADFFVVPISNAVPSWVDRARQREPELFRHSGGGRDITRLRLGGTLAHEPVAFRVLEPRPIEIIRTTEPLLELQLDRGERGQRIDLRPTLPLIIER